MSTMLRPGEIAVLLQADLNDIAVARYNDMSVADKVYFHVTADFQVYERLVKGEFELDDNQDITPVIISRIDHTEVSAEYVRYAETYEIKVYGYADQITSLEKIIKEYTISSNTTNKSEVISTFRVTKNHKDVSFGIELPASDGTLNKRVEGTGEFSWTFVDSMMTSYDITINIDGEDIPYLTYDFVDQMRTTQNEVIDSTGKTLAIAANSFYEIVLKIPYINTSTVIKSLYRELYEGSYNKKHTLTYYDTALNETFTFEVRMLNKEFHDIMPRVLDFTISLVKVYDTVEVKIDGVSVPVLRYEMAAGGQLDTATQINDDKAKSAFLGDNFQINMDISLADTTNTKAIELLTQVLNYDFYTPHLITLKKGTIPEITYSVLMSNGNYVFDINPDDRVSISFIEADDNV